MTEAHTAVDADGKLKGQNRIRLLGIMFSVAFTAIAVQLSILTLKNEGEPVNPEVAAHEAARPRPDIIDRNGVVMATDIAVASLFSDPRKITDIDEAELPHAPPLRDLQAHPHFSE